MNGKHLIIIFVVTVLFSNMSQAAKDWDIHTSYTSGGDIYSPVNSGNYLCGARVTFSCTRASDEDYWYDASSCTGDTEWDDMSPNYPQWTASAGSFEDGDYRGTVVFWIAPNTDTSGIYVSIYEDDLPYDIPDGETGDRDDTDLQVDAKSGIQANRPFLYTAEYYNGNHAIYDVTTPEYNAGPYRNEPAAWSFGANASVCATFYYGLSLSQAAGGVKVRAETSGDGFNIGDWGDSSTASWGTGWPTPNMYCESEATIDSDIQYQDYSAQWKYKCTYGSNDWINITNQTGCRLYVVYGAPTCSTSEYTKDHLEKATTYAYGGGSSSSSVCNTIQNYIHSHLNFLADTGPDGQNGVWNIITPGGSGNKGDCIAHANLMKVCLEVLGIDGSYAYVSDATNQPSEDAPSLQTYWCQTHGRIEVRFLREGAGGQTWNFEGVCGVGSTYYDLAWSTTSGTYEYCKTPGNGIVYEWVYMFNYNGAYYECGSQGGTHTPYP